MSLQIQLTLFTQFLSAGRRFEGGWLDYILTFLSALLIRHINSNRDISSKEIDITKGDTDTCDNDVRASQRHILKSSLQFKFRTYCFFGARLND